MIPKAICFLSFAIGGALLALPQSSASRREPPRAAAVTSRPITELLPGRVDPSATAESAASDSAVVFQQPELSAFNCPTCKGTGIYYGALCPTCDGAANAARPNIELPRTQPPASPLPPQPASTGGRTTFANYSACGPNGCGQAMQQYQPQPRRGLFGRRR